MSLDTHTISYDRRASTHHQIPIIMFRHTPLFFPPPPIGMRTQMPLPRFSSPIGHLRTRSHLRCSTPPPPSNPPGFNLRNFSPKSAPASINHKLPHTCPDHESPARRVLGLFFLPPSLYGHVPDFRKWPRVHDIVCLVTFQFPTLRLCHHTYLHFSPIFVLQQYCTTHKITLFGILNSTAVSMVV